MQSVYRSAGINPKDTGHVEAHGTGTKVGDPIEAAALHNVFGEERSARNPLYIGSVKSNIGHLGAASGKASQILYWEARSNIGYRYHIYNQDSDDA
jgi:acyl transferase domain-containing protein